MQCPAGIECNEEFIPEESFPDNSALREITALQCYCTNKGCDWTGKISELEIHLDTECSANTPRNIPELPPVVNLEPIPGIKKAIDGVVNIIKAPSAPIHMDEKQYGACPWAKCKFLAGKKGSPKLEDHLKENLLSHHAEFVGDFTSKVHKLKLFAQDQNVLNDGLTKLHSSISEHSENISAVKETIMEMEKCQQQEQIISDR
jgi:hypothetical protein